MDESVDTPGSVPRRRYQRRSDGHPSRPAIADQFQRPTRRLGRAVLERLRGAEQLPDSFLTLLRVGFA